MDFAIRAGRAYRHINLRVWNALKAAAHRMIGRTVAENPWLLGIAVLAGLAICQTAHGQMVGVAISLVSTLVTLYVVTVVTHR